MPPRQATVDVQQAVDLLRTGQLAFAGEALRMARWCNERLHNPSTQDPELLHAERMAVAAVMRAAAQANASVGRPMANVLPQVNVTLAAGPAAPAIDVMSRLLEDMGLPPAS